MEKWKTTEQMFGEGCVCVLNKKEAEQMGDFLAVMISSAREILDEVATFEATLQENKKQQRRQSEERARRKARARNKRRYAK